VALGLLFYAISSNAPVRENTQGKVIYPYVFILQIDTNVLDYEFLAKLFFKI
jgi:DNA-dependent RNA polymerase auxiliary subunit epsilon